MFTKETTREIILSLQKACLGCGLVHPIPKIYYDFIYKGKTKEYYIAEFRFCDECSEQLKGKNYENSKRFKKST